MALFGTAPLTVWQAIALSDGSPWNRRYRFRDVWDSLRYHGQVWWGGAGATIAAFLTAWVLQGPVVLATTRLEAIRPVAGTQQPRGAVQANNPVVQHLLATAVGAVERPAVRLAVLRNAGWNLVFPDLSAGRPNDVPEALRRLDQRQSVQVAPDGLGVIVAVWHRNPKAARALAEALAAFMLSHQNDDVTEVTPDPSTGLRDKRVQLATELEAADQRAGMLSQSLTELARDMVAAFRATDNHSVSTEVADQGAALLAELQLKRVQLASKYQDDFPALVALDGEIAKLRSVIAGEQRRSSMARSAANPVFTALAEERRRVSAELETLNRRREALRRQIASLDRPVPAQAVVSDQPRLVASGLFLTSGPDPRLLSLPLIALVGASGTLVLQWLLMRQRNTLVTPVEAELVLGVPVLRCLDPEGASTRLVEPPAWQLPPRTKT